ncbi:MAG: M15 family metallopeptidase [Patescibacteria group bacterium]
MEDFLSLHIARPYVYTILIVGLCAITYGYTTILDEKSNIEVKLFNTNIELSQAQTQSAYFQSLLDAKENEKLALQDTVEDFSNQVATLEKIRDTDKELLQKYSKVYFLNENYTPKDIEEISSIYLTPNSKPLELDANVLPFLKRMIRASIKANNPIQVVSAYRSFGTQENLKTAYKATFGSGANAFSADQGYSEHQLGTTVDLTTPILQNTFVSFEDTPAFKWLEDHAQEYGFTLSYPKGNKYYVYEPWHWRFVGVELATKLHDENIHFYDMDQREIDTYLLKIFD